MYSSIGFVLDHGAEKGEIGSSSVPLVCRYFFHCWNATKNKNK